MTVNTRRAERHGTIVLIAGLVVAVLVVGEWVLARGPWLLSMAATLGFIDPL